MKKEKKSMFEWNDISLSENLEVEAESLGSRSLALGRRVEEISDRLHARSAQLTASINVGSLLGDEGDGEEEKWVIYVNINHKMKIYNTSFESKCNV